MMNKHRIGRQILHLAVCCCVVVFFGCSQDDTCLEPQAVNMRAGFYHTDSSSTQKDTQLTHALIRFGASTTYVLEIKQSSKFVMPLAQDRDSTQLVFQSDSSTTVPSTIDTLTLNYTRKPTFISTACGYRTYFTLHRVTTTHHVIDSVTINHNEVSNEANKEHLKLYLH